MSGSTRQGLPTLAPFEVTQLRVGKLEPRDRLSEATKQYTSVNSLWQIDFKKIDPNEVDHAWIWFCMLAKIQLFMSSACQSGQVCFFCFLKMSTSK